VTLQCPSKAPSPSGKKCGRRERESRREGRREQSLREHSFTCRGGRRHPGRLEGGALRGALSERGPRSVRRLSRVSSRGSGAPMTAGVRRSPRRGTSSRMRASKRMHQRRHGRPSHAHRQTRPSLGPSTRARRSSLCTGRQKRLRGGAIAPASRLGKSTRVGGTNTGAGRSDVARLAACHRFRKGEGVTRREKEGGRGLRPCEDQESRLVARTSCFVAEVCRRPLVSNKLGIRAPKRAVRVE